MLVNWWGEQPRGEGTYPLSSTELRLLDTRGRVSGGGGMTDFGGVTGLQVVALTGGRVVAIGVSYMGTPLLTGMEPDIYTCRDAFGVAAGPANTLLTFAGAYGGTGVSICRSTAAGVLDTIFGTAGRSVGTCRAVNVLTQPDGRLVVVEAD